MNACGPLRPRAVCREDVLVKGYPTMNNSITRYGAGDHDQEARSPIPGPPPGQTDVTAHRRPSEAAVQVPPGRSWTIATSDGYVTRGYLPGWAEEDPSRTGVRPAKLRNTLHDIIHRAQFDGQLIQVARGGYGPGEQAWVFAGAIECIPDPGDGTRPIPVVNIHLFDDYWLTGLGPNELSVFTAQLRAQADRLDHDVRPRLIAYRADWSTHHRKPTPSGRPTG